MTLGEFIFSGSWLLILAVLVLDLIGVLHRGTGFRVQAVGLLVMDTAPVVSSRGHLHGRDFFPALFVGLAILAVGLIISFRDHRVA